MAAGWLVRGVVLLLLVVVNYGGLDFPPKSSFSSLNLRAIHGYGGILLILILRSFSNSNSQCTDS